MAKTVAASLVQLRVSSSLDEHQQIAICTELSS